MITLETIMGVESMNGKHHGSTEVINFATVLNSVQPDASVDVGDLPNSFVLTDGFANTDLAGMNNNHLRISIIGGDTLIDGTIANNVFDGSPIIHIARGFKSTGNSILVTNEGTEVTPNFDITLNLTLIGYYSYS